MEVVSGKGEPVKCLSAEEQQRKDDRIYCESYEKLQKHVLQGMKAAGFMKGDGVYHLFRTFSRINKHAARKLWTGDRPSPEFVQTVVRKMNEILDGFDMKIKSARCEMTGTQHYVFLVSAVAPVVLMPGNYTETERNAFLRIVDNILRKQNSFSISLERCCIMLEKQWSRVEVTFFVKRLISLRYFTEVSSQDEKSLEFTLGFRTMAECEPFFIDKYSESFAECCRCGVNFLNGYQCVECAIPIHHHCLKRHLQESKVCISCSASWENEDDALIRRIRGSSSSVPSTSKVETSTSAGNAPLRGERVGGNGSQAEPASSLPAETVTSNTSMPKDESTFREPPPSGIARSSGEFKVPIEIPPPKRARQENIEPDNGGGADTG